MSPLPDLVVRSSQVDGVPVFWLPVPGPLTARLVFRVGRADEQLVTSGLSHLVEHLALASVADAAARLVFNGQVGTLITSFDVSGDPDEVAGFLTVVCRALGDLPLDRMPVEKAILIREAAERGRSPVLDALLRERYGATSYALPAWDELGLGSLSAQHVSMWAATRFTRHNAVLWLSGPVPATLFLPLPDGQRYQAPHARSVLAATPAWFSWDGRATALHATLPRGAAAGALRHIAHEQLMSQLRHTRGAAYSPEVLLDRQDADAAALVCSATPVPGHEFPVRDTVVELLEGLADRPPTEEDVAAWRARCHTAILEPAVQRSFLDTYATDHLLGLSPAEGERWPAELDEVSPDMVAAAARRAATDALYLVPSATPLSRRGVTEIPPRRTPRLNGPSVQPRPQIPALIGASLVLAADGLELRLAHNSAVTVTANTCEALLTWPDGRRAVIDQDGTVIDVEPHHWRETDRIHRHLDTVFPPSAQLLMPARPASATQLPPRQPEPGRAWAAVIGVALLWVLLLGWVALTVHSMLEGHFRLAPLVVITSAGLGLGGLTDRTVRALWTTRRSLGLTGLPRFSD